MDSKGEGEEREEECGTRGGDGGEAVLKNEGQTGGENRLTFDRSDVNYVRG